MEETVVVRVVLDFGVDFAVVGVVAGDDFIGGGHETLWITVKITKNETILGNFILQASRMNIVGFFLKILIKLTKMKFFEICAHFLCVNLDDVILFLYLKVKIFLRIFKLKFNCLASLL